MSMSPSLRAGDWALAVRARRVARGDVVVLTHPLRPGLELVKRVVGIPGDAALSGGSPLGPDEWFVRGDNHATSTDSRTFGPVSRRTIVGLVRFVYWPPRRASRIGTLAPPTSPAPFPRPPRRMEA